MDRPSTVPAKVAVDGPSASGKSTVGGMLAEHWGSDFLDTGLMYRAVTLKALDTETNVEDASALGHLAQTTHFEIRRDGYRTWTLLINDEDLTTTLHDEGVNAHVSPISAVPQVRAALVAHQRRIADRGRIVMAGRDIGTVVLPDAPLKVFLTASDRTRATRRFNQIVSEGGSVPFSDVLAGIKSRDEIDSTRSHSPLRPPEDAIIISTDEVDAESAVERIIETYDSRVS